MHPEPTALRLFGEPNLNHRAVLQVMHGDGPKRTNDHAAVRELVARIRREVGKAVPDIDPSGPGTKARVVLLMLTPGPAAGGAQQTNVLSQETNYDQTARNVRRLMAEARLSPECVVFWNAIPWALERRRDPTVAELQRGAAYLAEFLALLPRRKSVVAMGLVAQRACRIAGVPAIEVPSPSPLAVAPPGDTASRKAERWLETVKGLARAAALADCQVSSSTGS